MTLQGIRQLEPVEQPETKLTYIIARTQAPSGNAFSLAPETSDITDNRLILGSVIGTLVRYGPSGLIEPALAESWKVSTDQLRWEFNLRPNLKCDDGEMIDAPTFVKHLKSALLRYAKSSKLMTFNHLKGWDQFNLNGQQEALGLKADGSLRIIFEFDTKTDEPLDSFTVAYFGFWCSHNFNGEKFRQDSKFISSGPYEILTAPKENSVVVQRSKNWMESDLGDFKTIEFKAEKLKNKIGRYQNTIVRLGMIPPHIEDKDQFNLVKGPPIYLTAFVLSPFIKDGLFKLAKNRKIFRDRLRRLQYPELFSANNLFRAKFFYENAPSQINYASTMGEKLIYSGQEVNINTPFRMGEEVEKALREIIISIMPEIPKDKLLFNDFKFDLSEYQKKIADNSYYDIRIPSVNIGGHITNSGTSGVEMMLCTKMGVSFPDPSGEVCHLSSSYTKLDKPVDQNFIDQFNQILYDDASVIPFFHSGLTWLYSKDIDVKTVPSGIGFPIFERLKLSKDSQL